MITRIDLKNFGPIGQLDWQKLGKINLVVGNNGSGKTFLLKAIYSAMLSPAPRQQRNQQAPQGMGVRAGSTSLMDGRAQVLCGTV